MTTNVNAQASQAYEDAQRLGKEQMDRTMAGVTVLSRTMQAIAAEIVDYQKKSFEDGSAAMEKLFAARSLDRAVEVQTEIARQAYESFVGRATRIGELYVDMTRDAYRSYEGALQNGR